MIETRRLTEEELNQLLKEAPDSETRNLIRITNEIGLSPYKFFDRYAVDYFGLLSNGRPIYAAVLIKDEDGQFNFWTVANVGKGTVISLCKYVKRELKEWLKRYSPIFATMERNLESEKWVRWLGFDVENETNDLITYKIGV